jgi:uncharacterized protein YecT (DUF1311 family)
VTAVSLAAAGAAAASAPPVIREPFTLLPCPAHPRSTIELEGCREHALVASDRRVDARAAAIFRLLPTAAPRAAFVRGERAWLGYRRASCSAQASVYAGGSLEPLAFLHCEAARNATHLLDLAQLENAVRHP